MKKIFILFSFFITIFSFSQSRLGSTEREIKNEFSDRKYELEENYVQNIYTISVRLEIAQVHYLFNSDKICEMVFIYPHNQGGLNYYVEMYNNQYVVISDKKWKMYSDNGIANIELKVGDTGSFFVWY